MAAVEEIIRTMGAATGSALRVKDAAGTCFTAVDPGELSVKLEAGAAATLVVAHTRPGRSSLNVVLAEGARLEVVEVFTGEAEAELRVCQAARSDCRLTPVLLSAAQLDCRIELNGAEARSDLGGVFLLAGSEQGSVRLRTAHNVADCVSSSVVKGVAGGQAVGRFEGLVYVAADAQRTDARQQSRNVLLSETARIITRPQLEIYADDVKCTHGATVGQMDNEAILYMRQRGLSEAQARRLQIEGFIGEVIRRCGIEPLCEKLMKLSTAKMEGL